MKRTPLTRKTPLRAKTGLRQGAPLKAKRPRRDRAEVALAVWCEIARPGTCTGRAQHRHHRILQSQGGRGGPTLDVCHACHDYAHLNRAEARAHGWIIDRQTA